MINELVIIETEGTQVLKFIVLTLTCIHVLLILALKARDRYLWLKKLYKRRTARKRNNKQDRAQTN